VLSHKKNAKNWLLIEANSYFDGLKDRSVHRNREDLYRNLDGRFEKNKCCLTRGGCRRPFHRALADMFSARRVLSLTTGIIRSQLT